MSFGEPFGTSVFGYPTERTTVIIPLDCPIKKDIGLTGTILKSVALTCTDNKELVLSSPLLKSITLTCTVSKNINLTCEARDA